jgi:hypothetical protein
MSSPAPEDQPGRPELPTGADANDPPPRSPRGRRWLLRFVPILVLLAGVLGWVGYEYMHHAPAERTPADALALNAAGVWWNVVGDRYLELDWEGRRASLWDYAASEDGVESVGSWSATKTAVIVQVSGPAGSFTQEFELIGNDAEVFLAPRPIKTARLLDSWIADHGDDEEDVSPHESMSHEAVWRHHGHLRHLRSHRRHQPGGFPA